MLLPKNIKRVLEPVSTSNRKGFTRENIDSIKRHVMGLRVHPPAGLTEHEYNQYLDFGLSDDDKQRIKECRGRILTEVVGLKELPVCER